MWISRSFSEAARHYVFEALDNRANCLSCPTKRQASLEMNPFVFPVIAYLVTSQRSTQYLKMRTRACMHISECPDAHGG